MSLNNYLCVMRRSILILFVIVSFAIIAFFIFAILRSESDQLKREAKLFFLQNELTLLLPEFDNSGQLTANASQDNGELLSWREKIVSHLRSENEGSFDYSQCFRDNGDIGNHTCYVAVTGDGTLWDEKLRKYVLKTASIDKILLIEVPDKTIRWDSSEDYDVEKALNLWNSKSRYRGLFRKRGIFYITLQGKHGEISNFKSQAEFRRNLVFSDEEIKQLKAKSVPVRRPENGERDGETGTKMNGDPDKGTTEKGAVVK